MKSSNLPKYVYAGYVGQLRNLRLTQSQRTRISAHRASKLKIVDKHTFLARFKKLWLKKDVAKEPLVVAMAAATMGWGMLIKHLRPEDLLHELRSLHIKRQGYGFIIKCHPALFTVLDLYFTYHYRNQLYPFGSTTISPTVKYRFNTTLANLELMEIEI